MQLKLQSVSTAGSLIQFWIHLFHHKLCAQVLLTQLKKKKKEKKHVQQWWNVTKLMYAVTLLKYNFDVLVVLFTFLEYFHILLLYTSILPVA